MPVTHQEVLLGLLALDAYNRHKDDESAKCLTRTLLGQKITASVIGNFQQVMKEGELRLHPIIARLVDKDVLERMGATDA